MTLRQAFLYLALAWTIAAAPACWTGDLTPVSPSDWTCRRAAYLLDRAGFGGTPDEIAALAAMSPQDAGIKGRTVDGLVQSIDLTATMLDASGAQLPQCQGQWLVAFTRGAGKPRDVAYNEAPEPQ